MDLCLCPSLPCSPTMSKILDMTFQENLKYYFTLKCSVIASVKSNTSCKYLEESQVLRTQEVLGTELHWLGTGEP